MLNTDVCLGSGERQDTRSGLPLVEAKKRFAPDEGERNEQMHLEESESSSWGEGEQRRRSVDSEQRTSTPGIVTARRRGKRKMKSCGQRPHVAAELRAQDKTLNLPQSTSSQVEQWETAPSSVCQSVSEEDVSHCLGGSHVSFTYFNGHTGHCSGLCSVEFSDSAPYTQVPATLGFPPSLGRETSPTDVGERSLCAEAEHDGEIGGLINSDGEVVDWDASE